MLYLLAVKALLYNIALTIASRVAVWKRMEAEPSFTVGYGFTVSDSDE